RGLRRRPDHRHGRARQSSGSRARHQHHRVGPGGPAAGRAGAGVMSAALEVAGLRVDGDAGVLLDIDRLVVDAGSMAVVTGATDSGKTLLASVLAGRSQASAG